MTTSKAILASLSLLFSSVTYTMDLVKPINQKKKAALTALMFKGGLQAPQSLKKHNPLLLHHQGGFHLIANGNHAKIPFENITGFKQKLTKE